MKEFRRSRGADRFRAALGLTWYYQLTLVVLWGVVIYLFISLQDEYATLIKLEPEMDKHTGAQMQAKTAYEKPLVDVGIEFALEKFNLPLRETTEMSGPSSARHCRCFSHINEVSMDYHLIDWEVLELNSLNDQHIMNCGTH